MAVTLRVDPVACDAFGHCAEIVPELVWLDEWGYPVIQSGPVPPALLGVVEMAVAACPRKALLLEDARRDEPARPLFPARGRPVRIRTGR